MPSSADAIAALLLGLMASGHCLAMCGGISSALGIATTSRRYLLIPAFSLGRVACYAMLGVLVGGAAGLLYQLHSGVGLVMRMLAALVLIIMACYIGGWWNWLTRLEAVGRRLWNRLSPLTRRLLPVQTIRQALAIGFLWGFLPCGLIYSALMWSSLHSASAPGAGLLMALFGIGTLPSMVGVALLGHSAIAVLQRQSVRQFAAVLLLAFGLWTLMNVLMAAQHGEHTDGHLTHPPHSREHSEHGG